MLTFKAKRTLTDLEAYLTLNGGELAKWLAREVKTWGEFSYEDLEAAIEDGRLNELLDWQERYSSVVNEFMAPAWLKAIEVASRKVTRGKIILSDSDDDVRTWLATHGAQLVTRLSNESRKAIANVLLKWTTELLQPKVMAQQIRPLIGLNERQTLANANYREKIYQRLLGNGMPPSKAAIRADKAAIRYASKQHRDRAETIVNTELAFAYNRGAHMGVCQSIARGYMKRCAMVWSTAGTNRVCGRCLELGGTVVGYTDEVAVQLPPLHPRCRCAIIYREEGERRALQPKPKPQPRGAMSEEDIPKWPPRDKAKIISREEYSALKSLAQGYSIALSNVKKFDGSAQVMREAIEALALLQEKFPAIRGERYPLTLGLTDSMSPKDFAITHGKIITLNANAYRDASLLAKEYHKSMEKGWFVKGTTWRAIIHHEFGHVVADLYKIDGLKIACEITGLRPKETLAWLEKNLSEYAGSFSDGGEIISEVFADVSTGNPSEFSRKFYDRVWSLTR